jgi:hypothetical protein
VYWLSLTDLVVSVYYCTDAAANAAERDNEHCGDPLCIFFAVVVQFFQLASIFWVGALAFNMQLTILQPTTARLNQTEETGRFGIMARIHAAVWGFSAASVVVLLPVGALGSAGQWCWVRAEFQWARFAFFYAPLVLVLCYTIHVFWRVRQRLVTLRRGSGVGSDDASVLPTLGRRFRNYILVFVIVFVPQLINRIDNAARPGDPTFSLYLLQSICGPLQGLGNAVVYGWTPRVRQLYSQRCAWCPGQAAESPPKSPPPALKGPVRARDLSRRELTSGEVQLNAVVPVGETHSSAI